MIKLGFSQEVILEGKGSAGQGTVTCPCAAECCTGTGELQFDVSPMGLDRVKNSISINIEVSMCTYVT